MVTPDLTATRPHVEKERGQILWKEVPFAGLVMYSLMVEWEKSGLDGNFDDPEFVNRFLPAHRQYGDANVRWQLLRLQDNPILRVNPGGQNGHALPPTAFEGYWFDRMGADAIETIARQGKRELDKISQRHRFDGYTNRFRRNLDNGYFAHHEDFEMIFEYEALYRYLLWESRSGMSDKELEYRLSTRDAVSTCQAPYHLFGGDKFLQTCYNIPQVHRPTLGLQFGWSDLAPKDQDGYWLMANIGKIGHPLVRRAVDFLTHNV